MREKLNNNPVYQAAFIGILALLVGLMLMMRMGGGGAAPPSSESTESVTTVVGGTAPATAPESAVPADPAAATAPATSVPTGGEAEFEAGPGLPARVVNAYDGGQAVGVLVVNRKGIDDRDLVRSAQAVGSRADVAVFVTDVKDVADFSRITQGVDVNRTPALVVLQPKRLAEGPMPAATVAYGFRGPASVEQAFEDAFYAGPDDLPYYP
jgi:hypothetical protein